jgi:hypothetical protein
MSDEKKDTSKQEPEDQPPAPEPRPPQRKELNSENSGNKIRNEKP